MYVGARWIAVAYEHLETVCSTVSLGILWWWWLACCNCLVLSWWFCLLGHMESLVGRWKVPEWLGGYLRFPLGGLQKNQWYFCWQWSDFYCITPLERGVDKIIKGSNHLISHYHLCDVVGMSRVDASGEFLDVMLYVECSGPVVLPVVPSFLVDWATMSFTSSLLEAGALEGILGTCCYHGWIGDGNCRVCCKLMTNSLFITVDGKRGNRIDTLIGLISVLSMSSCSILQ